MEKDIEIQQLARINQQKTEKLQKMRMNIQKLQMGMNKNKFKSNKSNLNNNPPEKQPTTIFDHYERQYSSTSPINSDKEFIFGSNLYKHTNQSQPVLENGSAVSNFSSVSNINNLLNGRLQQERQAAIQPKSFQKTYESHKQQNKILSEIDSLLQRSKKATKIPIKGFEKYMNIMEAKQSKNFSEIQEIESSRLSDKQKKNAEPSARTKLEEYKKFINTLDITTEHKKSTESYHHRQQLKKQRQKSSNLSEQQQDQQFFQHQKSKSIHKKAQHSDLSRNTQLLDSYPRLPPHPSGRTTVSTVDRHKALIQQTFQERKKLKAESSHQNLDRSQLDFELSDEQNQQQKTNNQSKVQALLEERKQLREDLRKIELELQQLQNSD